MDDRRRQCWVRRRRLIQHLAGPARVRGALRVPKVRDRLLADPAAGGFHSRPASLDGKFTWSPQGERAIVIGGTVHVLNYVWSGWDRDFRVWCSANGPRNSLALACAHGRIDLLDHMLHTGRLSGVQACNTPQSSC